MRIGVIGGEDGSDEALRLAFEVGQQLALRGHTLICGGRGGVMREACRGAKDAGGLTVAVLPGDDASEANNYVDVPIVTGIGFARNSIIARTAQALIAVEGRYGTLSEIAFAFIADRPVVGLRTWELRSGVGEEPPIVRVETAEEAVAACEEAVEQQ